MNENYEEKIDKHNDELLRLLNRTERGFQSNGAKREYLRAKLAAKAALAAIKVHVESRSYASLGVLGLLFIIAAIVCGVFLLFR